MNGQNVATRLLSRRFVQGAGVAGLFCGVACLAQWAGGAAVRAGAVAPAGRA